MSTMFQNMSAQVAGSSWRSLVIVGDSCDALDAPVGATATAFRAQALDLLVNIAAVGLARGFDAAVEARDVAVRFVSAAWTSVGAVEPTDSRSADSINALIPAAV